MNKPSDENFFGSLIRDDRDNNEFLVRRMAFTSADILQRERERIFSRCWLYLGHESEVPRAHDFITRKVGGRKLIFVRDADNRFRAFYNTCTHRGALVCREPRGNAKHFVCGYHGWTFNTQGEHVDEPGTSGYPDDFFTGGDKNLYRVPQIDSYRGFVFVNFDAAALGLREYLGEGKALLDLVADQDREAMVVSGGTQKYSMRANWKLLVENSADGYHGVPTHATYFDYMMSTHGAVMADFNPANGQSRGYEMQGGHAMIEYSAPWGRPVAQWVPQWGEEGKRDIAAIQAELAERLGRERAERIASLNRNMFIFPNLVINDIMATTIRVFEPIAPDYIEISAWSLGPKNEAERQKANRLYNFLEFLGPGGFATPDDVEMLELCQQGYQNMEEVAWNDISKGMNLPQPTANDELQMRAFWRQWNKLMEEK